MGVADELQQGDPDRTGPSRSLPLRPALAGTLAVPGCRAVYAVTFGLDGDVLAAADGNGFTYLWDMAGGLAATFAHPGSRGVIGVAFDPDNELLAAADANGRAYLWDLISGDLARTFVSRRSGGLNGVAFGLDGDLLAAAGGTGASISGRWSAASPRVPSSSRAVPPCTRFRPARRAGSWPPRAVTAGSTCGT